VAKKIKYPQINIQILLFYCFLALLSGCNSPEEPMPEIVYSPSFSSQFPPPLIEEPTQSYDVDSYADVPRAWLPPSEVEKEWTAIIIHHSATEKGNAAIFDKDHRENHGWDGIGYDFVIGNGTDSGNGQVEVTFRWRRQITGAHCKTPENWANEDGIGICLVGNFNNSRPTERQMQSLVSLTRFLKNRYGISNSRIYGHGTTPGAHVTDCPGAMFPMARFKSMLGY
jgi:N-acetylmuramoyl-L-alanine amidase